MHAHVCTALTCATVREGWGWPICGGVSCHVVVSRALWWSPGKYVVLFFYPLDFTFVCPTEICQFSKCRGTRVCLGLCTSTWACRLALQKQGSIPRGGHVVCRRCVGQPGHSTHTHTRQNDVYCERVGRGSTWMVRALGRAAATRPTHPCGSPRTTLVFVKRLCRALSDDRADEFRAIGCEVVAASVDSKYCHLAWCQQSRREGGLGLMTIPIVADITKKISKDYGVLIEDGEDAGVAFRGLFIIGALGVLKQWQRLRQGGGG